MTYFFSIWYADYHVARLSFCCACFEESDVVFVSYGQILHFKSHISRTCKYLQALAASSDLAERYGGRAIYKLLGERHWEFRGNISNVRIVNRTFYNTLLSSAVPGIAWYWKCLNQSDHVQSCTSRSSLANHKRKTPALLPSPVHRSQMCCQYEWRCMHASTRILFGIIVSGVVNDLCARCSNVKLLLRITTWIRCFPMLSMHQPLSDWIKSNLTSSHSKGVESHYISVSAWEIWGAGIGGRRSGLWFLVTWQTCEGS
jgi:hypothetical protein